MPESAVEIEISPEWDDVECPLKSSMLPPLDLTTLREFVMDAISVVDPECIFTLPPSPTSPVPTVRWMCPPLPGLGVHGSSLPMLALQVSMLMLPEGPSVASPDLNVRDPLSPRLPALEVAITTLDKMK